MPGAGDGEGSRGAFSSGIMEEGQAQAQGEKTRKVELCAPESRNNEDA